MKAIVLGATGQIGSATCRALLRAGHELVACHRGFRSLQPELKERGCKEVVGDRHSSEEVARELQAGADCLIDVVPMVEADVEQLLAVSSAFGSIVAVSSAAVYADDQGRSLGSAKETGFPEFPPFIPESQPTVGPDTETYAGRKVLIERRLFDEAKCGVTVLRPTAIYGPFARDLREVWFLKRLLDRRSVVPLAYNGESCFHTCAAESVAAAAVAGAEAPGRRVLNVADADAPTVREIGETLLGPSSALEIVCFAGPPAGSVGMSPWSAPKPIRLDTTALVDLTGTRPHYRDVVGPAADWARRELQNWDWESAFPKLAAYPMPLFDYAAEDAFMREARGAASSA